MYVNSPYKSAIIATALSPPCATCSPKLDPWGQLVLYSLLYMYFITMSPETENVPHSPPAIIIAVDAFPQLLFRK